jgi:hypothetical protein
MGVDSIVQRWGDLSLPVEAADFDTTLTPLDPARAKLTALFKAAINYEFTEVWQKIVGSAGGTTGLGATHDLYGTLPVQDTLELQPTHKFMLERKAAFPLLAVYRMGNPSMEQHTLFRDRLTCQWGMDYVVGPLTVAAVRQVGDICMAIVKLVRTVIRQRGHKAYEAGALQFFPDKGGLASIDLKSFAMGQIPFAGDEDGTVYYSLSMTLETSEIGYDDPAEFGDFDAADYTVGVGDATDVVPDLVEAASDVPVVSG